MKNIKLHFIALCLVIISEYIGIVKFNLGKGIIALFPMLYAMIFGVVTKFLKISNEKVSHSTIVRQYEQMKRIWKMLVH